MAILAGSWPTTSPETWDDASQAQSTKANQLVQNCEGLRDTANQLIRQQSGQMIDGMHEMLIRKAGEISDQADSFFALSRGSEEVARLLCGQREDLDKIDRDAHQQTEEIRAAVHGFASQMGVGQAVMAEVMAASAQAKGVDATAAGNITAQTVKMGLLPPEDESGGAPDFAIDPSQLGGFGGGGGRPGPGGMPQAPAGLGQKPDAPAKRGSDGSRESQSLTFYEKLARADPSQTTTRQGDPTSAANGLDPTKHLRRTGAEQGAVACRRRRCRSAARAAAAVGHR